MPRTGLRLPVRPAKAAATIVDPLSDDDDSDGEAHDLDEDGEEPDEAEGDLMQFPEAAE
ncbi:hypothetical protein [Agrobacterium radiobacter]|uniref:hypothetical protein n=1 Tax=Agrobacterium radiobacter TaxID=362 RepID=UPI000AAC39AE|nr:MULTISPECIES: hypothetical protein [Agrobacterium tumefaciens complex]NIB12788.1 hypothetical protein [Agrobacterium radiobacter]